MSSAISAPAKINLRLKLCGLRPDGYHLLSMLNASLELADTLAVTPTAAPGLTLCVEGLAEMGPLESNLCLKAAAAYIERNPSSSGWMLHLTKRIPVGAGLGGGSSDAAAVLRALNHLASRPLSHAALSELALTIGADVPYFLTGGLCRVEGVGERIQQLEFNPLAGRECILVNPGFPIATAEVYALSRKHPIIPSVADLPARRNPRTVPEILELIDNDLLPYVSDLRPVLKNLLAALGRAEFARCGLSGSGSTLFLIHRDREKFEELELCRIKELLRPFKADFLVTNFLPNPTGHVK